LFDGTIKENIFVEEIGKQNSKLYHSTSNLGDLSQNQEHDQEIIKHMIDFGFAKQKLEKEGLNYKIINNGENLSLGEKQLISLMKAFYTQKKIIILDEVTSNIDYQSERKIMDFLYDRTQEQTLVMIAHRINTVLRCNRIVVLEEGKIVEVGNTQELIENKNSRFYQLYRNINKI
jgi:ABC-type multidrug transport system fused ATPase/permease subunit